VSSDLNVFLRVWGIQFHFSFLGLIPLAIYGVYLKHILI